MQKRRWISLMLALVLTLALAGGVAAQANDAEADEAEVEAEVVAISVEVDEAEAEEAPPTILADDSPVAATLAGNRGGSFNYYVIEYPGDATNVNIRVEFAPGDPATLMAVGFNVYGPDGFFIGAGQAAGAAKELMYSSDSAETWLIQVYNYGDITVSYTIAAEGLAAAEPVDEVDEVEEIDDVEPVDEPIAPVALEEEGMLVGSRAGAFAVYEFEYDGEEELDLTLTYWPDDPSWRAGVGLKIYGPDGWSVTAPVAPGERVASLNGAPAGAYIVQVYNYIEGLELSFALSH